MDYNKIWHDYKIWIVAVVVFWFFNNGDTFNIPRNWFLSLSILGIYFYNIDRNNALRYKSNWIMVDGIKDSSILPPLRLSFGFVARSLGDLPNDAERGQNGTCITPLGTNINLNKGFVNLGFAKFTKKEDMPSEWLNDLEKNGFNLDNVWVCYDSLENMTDIIEANEQEYSKIDLITMLDQKNNYCNQMQKLLENKNIVIQSEVDYGIGKLDALNKAAGKDNVKYIPIENRNGNE